MLLKTAAGGLCAQTLVALLPAGTQAGLLSFGTCIYFQRKTKAVSPRASPSLHFVVL